jgi:hypothetical protein
LDVVDPSGIVGSTNVIFSAFEKGIVVKDTAKIIIKYIPTRAVSSHILLLRLEHFTT